MAIMTSLHTLFTLSYSSHTFPPIFVLFHMLFHLSHLVAHLFGVISLERFCIVYGTSIYWTGWLIGMFVFRSERIPLDFTVVAFWLLVLERRNAWGLVVWEFVSQLEDIAHNQAVAFGNSIRLIAFRIWCIFGVGSAWALVYLPLAVRDGFVLASLLSPTNVIRLFFVSAVGGLGMICFWSFWTFQYRGVVWQREMRKGIAVWCSDGIARAADIM
ncbi:hypothetical protein BJV82DRAFT_600625 [Fennellomyces sp. T-0311]|nr:hypothetical protein BJV82DRAFT_600625 [Fennellomyces sp. T-0311]